VTITFSSANRVEGTFRFEGFRYCARVERGSTPPIGPCRIPDEPIPDAPPIAVSGSFVVTPLSNIGIRVD
jgi:hypothetical protein